MSFEVRAAEGTSCDARLALVLLSYGQESRYLMIKAGIPSVTATTTAIHSFATHVGTKISQ
jgi:hypothetical protein